MVVEESVVQEGERWAAYRSRVHTFLRREDVGELFSGVICEQEKRGEGGGGGRDVG